MGNYPMAEERGCAVEGTVGELIGNNELGRLVLFLQRTHCRNGENTFHAEVLHSVNIGAEIQLSGK